VCVLFITITITIMNNRTVSAQQDYVLPPVPSLNGRHFNITVLHENGFLDIIDNENEEYKNDDDNNSHNNNNHINRHQFYHDNLRNFTFTLLPPSGMGSACVPRLQLQLNHSDNNDNNNDNNNNDSNDNNETFYKMLYDKTYRTQYNCGASDVNDITVFGNNNNTNNNTINNNYSTINTTTDMYLGMYYVSPARQLINHFTIPFLPPYSGTLAMFGTATHLSNFTSLVQQQQQQQQQRNNTTTTTTTVGVRVTANTTCGPAGTALIQAVQEAYPGLQVKGILGDEDVIYQHFYNQSCTVYITDGPIAAQFILRRSGRRQCTDRNGAPLGVIGDPMPFGLSHYAIGIRKDIDIIVVNTISYWMNRLMVCNPLDPDGDCPNGNLASFYSGTGGTGTECGYVAFPEAPPSPTFNNGLSPGEIVGIVVGSSLLLLLLVGMWHRYRLLKQQKAFAKKNQAALQTAEREREFNEFMVRINNNNNNNNVHVLYFVMTTMMMMMMMMMMMPCFFRLQLLTLLLSCIDFYYSS
jgi:hypothetical protein